MIVVWGDGEVTLSKDGADDAAAPLSEAESAELARLLATSRKLAFVLAELAALVEEHGAAVLAAVAARTQPARH